jgi:hypothetical protein
MHGIGKSVTTQLFLKPKPRLPSFSFVDTFGVLLRRQHLQCDN